MENEIVIDVVPILERIGSLVKRDAIRKCPVDMGNLRRSIDYRVEPGEVIIFSYDKNAEAMEFGMPPGPLTKEEKGSPDDGIDAPTVHGWAKRHDASAKGIIWSLEHRGIKVGTAEEPLHITSFGRDSYRPFLRSAAFQNISAIPGVVSEVLK